MQQGSSTHLRRCTLESAEILYTRILAASGCVVQWLDLMSPLTNSNQRRRQANSRQAQAQRHAAEAKIKLVREERHLVQAKTVLVRATAVAQVCKSLHPLRLLDCLIATLHLAIPSRELKQSAR